MPINIFSCSLTLFLLIQTYRACLLEEEEGGVLVTGYRAGLRRRMLSFFPLYVVLEGWGGCRPNYCILCLLLSYEEVVIFVAGSCVCLTRRRLPFLLLDDAFAVGGGHYICCWRLCQLLL